MPDNFAFMGRKIFISKKGPKTGMGSSVLHFCCQDEIPMLSISQEFFFNKNSKKFPKRPIFTNKIFSTNKRKVVGHEKLVNIGPSDQVFIGGKVVLIPNNPAEESQVISF